MAEVIRTGDGKKFEVTCGYYCDESIPNEKAKIMCFDPRGNPKCPLFKDCWIVFTNRRDV
jgi:hypothetical protein